MRLLFASNVANREWTGMGGWTHRISEVLREQGHAVELWFSENFPPPRWPQLDPLIFPVRLAERLVRRARDFDVAVVHEPSGFWYGLGRRALGSLPPIVAMSHGVESHAFELQHRAVASGLALNTGSRWRNRLVRRWQSDGTLRLADHVLCLSTLDARYLTEAVGVSPDRITVFCNGVRPEEFVEPGARRDAEVLFLGSWIDRKGRILLPPLWREVAREMPTARLTLVGTGAEAAEVLAGFDTSLRGSLRVIPKIEHREALRALLREASVFLMPSLFEGSPLSLIEALAAALPVVATPAGGIPDLITHEQTGLIFDARDVATGARQVLSLLRDRDRATALGQCGQARARSLTWEASANAVLAACQKALAVKATGGRAG